MVVHCLPAVPSPFSPSISPPPPLPLWHAAARNCSITAGLTPVYESRPGTFKSKVTASEASNLHLKGRAPPLTLTAHYLHPLSSSSPQSHIRSSRPPRDSRPTCCCVCVRVHLSCMNVCFDPVAHYTPAVHRDSSIQVRICHLFLETLLPVAVSHDSSCHQFVKHAVLTVLKSLLGKISTQEKIYSIYIYGVFGANPICLRRAKSTMYCN